MSNHLRIMAIVAVLAAIFCLDGWTDTVELTDGRKIEGIVQSVSDVEVTIKLDTGAVVRFPRSKVRTITRDDWQHYVQKGDRAEDPAQKLEFYQKAKQMNPTAPGLEAKIRQAQLAVENLEQKRKQQEQKVSQKTEDARILAEYQRLMDAVRPDAARDLLERAIAEKPYLCQPRIKLAAMYERETDPETRVHYVEILVGLVRNDPKAYYPVYAPVLMEAAEAILLDGVVSATLPFRLKDRLVGLTAPFVGENGALIRPEEYEKQIQKTPSPVEATLAKLELLKNICSRRPAGEPPVEPDLPQMVEYKKQLNSEEGREALDLRLNAWSGQSNLLLAGGETVKAAAVAEVVLVFRPNSVSAQTIVAAWRGKEIRELREKKLYDTAVRNLEAAEKVLPESPVLGAERAQLYLAMSRRHSQRNDFERAIRCANEAGRGRVNDPQLTAAVTAAKSQIFETLMIRAETRASRDDFGTAIQMVELARTAKPMDPIAMYNTRQAVKKYKSKARERLLFDIFQAAAPARLGRPDYDKIVAARTTAMQYGVWLTQGKDKGDKPLANVVADVLTMVKAEAKEREKNNDTLGVFKRVGGSQALAGIFDRELAGMRKTASDWVEAGNLPLGFFEEGRWEAPGITWDIGPTHWRFVGRGISSISENLYSGSIQIQHQKPGGTGTSPIYELRVDGPNGLNKITLSVTRPDRVFVANYETPAPEAPEGRQTVAIGTELKWVPPPPPAQGTTESTPESDASTPPPSTSDDES